MVSLRSKQLSRRNMVLLLAWKLIDGLPSASAYFAMPFNTTHSFGPDGPWPAVVVDVRHAEPNDTWTTVNLLPHTFGSYQAAHIPSSVTCANASADSVCGIGGTIDPARFPGLRSDENDAWYQTFNQDSSIGSNYSGPITRTDLRTAGRVIGPDLRVNIFDYVVDTYPTVNFSYFEIGTLGLWSGQNVPDPQRELNIVRAQFEDEQLSSDSFNLHLGDARRRYNASLILGGYDRARSIGPVVPMSRGGTASAAWLLDIEIGTETGGSPFPFRGTQNGFLPNDFAARQPPLIYENTNAWLFPEVSYIGLPAQAISDIIERATLPVRSERGFFLWNTDDPAYERIVQSPGYIGFTFATNTNASTNATIKVPFALLNLTLTSRVTGLDRDVPWFPLMVSDGVYWGFPIWLGKAFLQATLYGGIRSTGGSREWLVQAPGPGVGDRTDLRDLEPSAATIDTQLEPDLFAQSWADHWTPLPSDAPLPSSSEDSGLSGGQIAGIVVGVVVGVALVAIAVILFWLRRRRRQRAAAAAATQEQERAKIVEVYANEKRAQEELSGQAIHELENFNGRAHEMPDKEAAELRNPHSEPAPQELSAEK